jgi:hypothetical protein
MALYLHELVDSVAGRTEDYLDSMAKHHGTAAVRLGRKDAVLGLWSAIEATGTWPLAVNMWEWGTWTDAAAILARQFEPDRQDPELKKWWLGNLDLRTGGYDRLVESTTYSPDVAALRSRGVSGALFLHQIVRIEAGACDEFLTAFGDRGVPALEGEGATLVGAYRVRMRDDEVITLFAFAEPGDLARFQSAWYDARSRLGGWRIEEDRWVRGKSSLMLKPRHFLSSPWHR